MYLDVYFNAQAISSSDKQKRGPANALVPTSIAYPGGQVEFPVDMGPEASYHSEHRSPDEANVLYFSLRRAS